MRKLILTLAAALMVSVTTVSAQVTQYYLGSGQNEIATCNRVLTDNSVIVAGYSWDFSGQVGNTVLNSRMLMLRISSTGVIMWQKEWGASGNNTINDFIITADGQSIVAVGTVGRDANWQNNTAAIFRISVATGLIQHEAYVRDQTTTTAGEVFNSVCELQNGDIVAVGTHDQRAGAADGLISVFTPTLGIQYTRRTALESSMSDEFNGVVASGNTVYIAGVKYNGSEHDATLSQFTPGTAYPGTLNWSRRYAYAVDNRRNTVGGKLQVMGNTLVVDGWVSTDCCGQTDMRQVILRTDLTGGSASVKPVYNGNTFANSHRAYAITADEIYVAECPASTFVDPLWNGSATTVNGTISHITSLNSGSFAFTRGFNLPGPHSILGIDRGPSGLVLVGGASDDPSNSIGGKDIYFVRSDMNVTASGPEHCLATNQTYTIGTPTPTVSIITETAQSLGPIPQFTLPQSDAALTVRYLCGERPDTTTTEGCDDKCYWKLDGNASVTASNFIGSTNPADLVMKTSNNEWARIKSSGEIGIHKSGPAANLDVQCMSSNYPSGLRFENLPRTYQPLPMLVVDPAGYVYQYHGSIYQYPGKAGVGGSEQGAAGSTEQEIATLKEQVRVLTEYVTKLNNGAPLSAATSATGSAMSVYPNPTDGAVNVKYDLPAGFKSASIVITDMKGRKVMEETVSAPSGTAFLVIPSTVSANELVCTLYADGKAIGSQKLLLYKK